MLFPPTYKRDEILSSIAQALESAKSAIFLDASLLIHCYEMSPAARDELLAALERMGSRVKVPLWAAWEVWQWSNEKISKNPLQSLADGLSNNIALFATESRRYIDDNSAPDLTKTQYESQLDNAALELVRLAMLVASLERKPDQTSAALMPFIEARRLDSRLSEIVVRVSKDAEVRAMHGIPPGFGDARTAKAENSDEATQKGKKKNRHGDQIIWQEILDAADVMEAEELVLVTQDINKGDWVYKPKRLLDEAGRPQENSSTLTVAHPLLVQEALGRCKTLKSVHVISVATLALVLRTRLSQPVMKLVSALQSTEELLARYRRASRQDRPVAELAASPSVGTEVAFRSTDLSYEPSDENVVDQVITKLWVEDWTVQNKAVQDLEPVLPQANRDQLIQIGRAVAKAINESAVEPLEFLKRILGDGASAQQLRSNILIGVLAHIYFNEAGDPKRPGATPELTSAIFASQADVQLKPAFDVVLDRLRPQRRAYVSLPTDSPDRVSLVLGVDRNGANPTLRSASFGNVELVEEAAPESRRILSSGRDELLTVEELLYRISSEFAVPVAILEVDQAKQVQLLIPANTGFVRWGPGTGVTLR